jgi:DNA-binding XRE family transcriptional regulator/mannose-6-phosphate isomerase-like protein (cupin superfamily)
MAKAPAPSPAASTPDAASVTRQIGATVRRLRNSLGLTLGEVAKRSHLSAAMLSRLENGSVSPSLESLAALTAALGVPLGQLFGDVGKPRGGAQHVPRGGGLEVVRRGTKRGHTYHLLAADRGPRRVFEPFLVTLNDRSEVFPGFEHPGTEFIYLLEGSLTYRHGDETHLLKAGDSLTFAGAVPHGPEKLLKTPIRMLSIIIYAETAANGGAEFT